MGRPAYPKISKNTYLYINGKKASNAPERKLIYNIAVRNNSYFKISIGRLTFFAIQTSIQSKPSVSLYLSKLTQNTLSLSLSLSLSHRSSRSSLISLSLSQIFAFFFNLSLSEIHNFCSEFKAMEGTRSLSLSFLFRFRILDPTVRFTRNRFCFSLIFQIGR